jgi:hypothetical protein
MGEKIELLEDNLLINPDIDVINNINKFKRKLFFFTQ